MMEKLLLLIIVANGAPVLLSYLCHHRAAQPIDFGLSLPDKRRLFGDNKTWRGLVSSIIFTMLIAELVGLGYITGLQLAGLAMFGDLLSSFIKRRFAAKPGTRVLFLDQVPESLLPAWAFMEAFSLNFMQVIAIVIAFIIVEECLSFILYKLGVRKTPY